MMGQTINSGTGFCKVLLDEDFYIKNLSDVEEEISDINSDLDNLLKENDEGECSNENFKFSFE